MSATQGTRQPSSDGSAALVDYEDRRYLISLCDVFMPAGMVLTILPVLWLSTRPIATAIALVLTIAMNLVLSRASVRLDAVHQERFERIRFGANVPVTGLLVLIAGPGTPSWLLAAPWMLGTPLVFPAAWAIGLILASIAVTGWATWHVGLPQPATSFALGSLLFFGIAFLVLTTALRNRSRTTKVVLAELRHALSVKQAFLRTMSHELRTPMHGVVGMADILEQTNLTAEQRECAHGIRTCSHAMMGLINDVLDLARIERSGDTMFERIPFALQDLLQEVVAIAAGSARERGLQLATEFHADAPRWVAGDPVRVRQILTNLVGNAVKFTAAGSVTVRVLPAGAERLRFEVVDTGIGVEPEAQARIFDEFTQADSSITRRFGGTGLGLAICRRLVEQMGGEIGVHSRPGHGSTFWFVLPLPPAAVGTPSTARATRPVPSRRRVLLAEDNAINQRVAVRMLQRLGQEVVVVGNGQEALETCRRQPFDLVLMDCQMPVLDGLSATRELRRIEGADRRTKVVAMTANVADEDRRECAEAGMDDFLGKPVTLEALADLLARLDP